MEDFKPETLAQCQAHYVFPNKKYISCEVFGQMDGMSGGCWWCKEMTPYQWHMCSDEKYLNQLINGILRGSKSGLYNRKTGADFIEQEKLKDMKCKLILRELL